MAEENSLQGSFIQPLGTSSTSQATSQPVPLGGSGQIAKQEDVLKKEVLDAEASQSQADQAIVPDWLAEAQKQYSGNVTQSEEIAPSVSAVPQWLNQVKQLGIHEKQAKLDENGNVILENVSKAKEGKIVDQSVQAAGTDDLDGLIFEPPTSVSNEGASETDQGNAGLNLDNLIVETLPAEPKSSLSALPAFSINSSSSSTLLQDSKNIVRQNEAASPPSWVKNLEGTSIVQQKLQQESQPISEAQKKMLEYITPPKEEANLAQEQAQKASLNFDKLTGENESNKKSAQENGDNLKDKNDEEVKKKQEKKLEQKKTVFADLSIGLLSLLDKGKAELEKGKVAGIAEAQRTLDSNQTVSLDKSSIPSSASEQNNSISVKDKKTVSSGKVLLEEKQKLIEAEKMFQEGMATVRDLIAPSSMEIKYDLLRIEGVYARSFYVYAYPRYLDTNWLSPVVNLDVTMDVAQFIYPIDSAKIMRILKKKVTQMQSAMAMNAEKGLVRDPALETAYEDAEQLRTEIQRGQEKFFQFAMYFTLYADDDKKLVKVSKQLESILGSKLILTKRTDLRMEHGFTSTLPLCLDEIEVYRNMNTSPLSTTFPFSSTDLTSNEGVLYGLNRHNDSLIIFDRFSLENANSVVFAKSGAGKSYAVKLEILRYLMLGTDVIVIDPENEYEALAQTVGGAYLKVSLTSDRRINPFDLPSPLKDEELQPGDLLRSNIINLHGLLKIMLGGVTPVEEGIIDKALNDVYALKGITMDILDPSELPVPTMEDLYDLFINMEGGQSLAQRLQKYTQGTYSGIFNKPTNVDLKSGLMVFSIRDLEDALRPIAMYIILNFIWNRVRSSLKRRIMVVDEAWTMMQYEDSAKFLFGLVKRARKYYLGITTITQDVEDFIKSPYGKPIVTNTSMQLLLKQAPAAMDTLSKIFNLTEGEKYMLLNSGIGQGLFFAGLKHVAIQCIASYTEDKIVTTNPEEILRDIGAEAKKGLKVKEVLSVYIKSP